MRHRARMPREKGTRGRDRRGDLTSPLIIWITTIMAAIIIVIWYARSGTDETKVIQRIDEDLRAIHYDINLACANSRLSDRVPLNIRDGEFTANTTDVCLTSPGSSGMITRCLYAPCDLPETAIAFEDGIAMRIEKESSTWEFTVERQ